MPLSQRDSVKRFPRFIYLFIRSITNRECLHLQVKSNTIYKIQISKLLGQIHIKIQINSLSHNITVGLHT